MAVYNRYRVVSTKYRWNVVQRDATTSTSSTLCCAYASNLSTVISTINECME